jgi:hypothetical protein
MDTIFHIISILGMLFTLAMTVLTLLRSRQEKRTSVLGPLFSILISLAILPVFILLSGARLNLLIAIPILVVGLLVGFLRGLTIRLYYKNGQVVGKNSLLFLLGWGGSLALAQIFNILGSALLASIGLIPVFLSTGTHVGMDANVLLRRLMIKPSPPVPPTGYAQSGPPRHTRLPSPATFPEQRHVAAPPPPSLPERPPRSSNRW